jgi:uncharacterized membrane protein
VADLAAQAGAEPEARRVTWPMIVSGILCLAGIAVAAYLTYAHYSTAKVLACSDKGLVNCAKVTTSKYSRIFGVPVSDTGLGFFLVMAVLCSPPAWRSMNPVVRGLRLIGAASGAVMILWLVYVELFRLDAICLYCTAVHVITVLLFITVAIGTVSTSPTYDEADELDEELDEPSDPDVGSEPADVPSDRVVPARSSPGRSPRAR